MDEWKNMQNVLESKRFLNLTDVHVSHRVNTTEVSSHKNSYEGSWIFLWKNASYQSMGY